LAECRSADHTKAEALAAEMERVIRAEVEACGAKVEIVVDEKCRAVRIPEDAWAVRVSKQALASIGITAKAVFITGFTDASIYNNRGIEMAVVGIGAQNEHSSDECVAVADMERAVAMLVEVFRIAAQDKV
jgi:tripeptide aminopeptidase